MFERNFTYKDLEQIETEIKNMYVVLANIYKNKSYIWKISRTLDKLKKSNFSSVEKIIINIFESGYAKRMNRTDEAIDFLQKFTKQDNFKILSDTARGLINEIEQYLLVLKQDNIYSANRTAFRTTIIRYIKSIKILKEEKEIIERYIKSRNIKEQKNLNYEFFEKENVLYDVYNNLSNILEDASIMQSYIRHMKNSIYFNFLNLIFIAAKHIVLLFWMVVFIGGAFCLPYFFKIGIPPQINTTEIIPLLFFVGALGLLYVVTVGLLSFIGSYFIFNVKTNQKWINRYFIIIQIYLFAILTIPFLYEIKFFSKYLNPILNNFGAILVVYFIVSISYFVLSMFKTGKFKDDVNLFIFLHPLFDFLLIVIVYSGYKDIVPPVFLCFFLIIIVTRIAAFSKYFDYKIVFWLSFLIGLGPMWLLSPDFVRMIKLANYKANFIVKNEFIESEKLDKIPLCFKDYNDTCKNLKLSDDNKTAINNLIVKVKFDEQYFFKAQVPKDEFNITKERIMRYQDGNSTDISQKMFKIFKVKECEHNSTVSCYIDNDKEGNITIKHYHKDMENIIQNENDKYFIEFPVRKENILN
ncbi:hypothetical protein [Campylobacter rectus]|uniref:hypothetical protein n=1 Tax=Campylobacter rectus TaxID=203 RepID=UPI0028DD3EC6|nr:hypothetical protein [Campylobacter rectus]